MVDWKIIVILGQHLTMEVASGTHGGRVEPNSCLKFTPAEC